MAHKKRHHHAAKHHEKKHHSMHHERRYHEMREAGMISEDHSAPANMPQEVKYVAYPRYDHGVDTHLDDTITGIDRQVDSDVRAGRRAMYPTKY